MKSLKFGIIGCSRIAKRSVIPAILKSEFAELEIIGSRSTDKAKEFAKEFSCEKFGTYDDVISNNSVDVVYISTPIHTHAEWSNKSTAAGKHVYVEKSSTYDLKSAKEMVESAKENNVRLMEGFMFRFHPQHQKVKELIKEGKNEFLVETSIDKKGKYGRILGVLWDENKKKNFNNMLVSEGHATEYFGGKK